MDTTVHLPEQRRMLASGALVAVTGAGGYSGRVLTRALLEGGVRVRNLTGHPQRPTPPRSRIESASLDFARPDELERSLRGAAVLFNTYWVRFPHRGRTHALAVANSRVLFEAARRAGVGRVVHTSIANPSEDSPLSYYRGKAQVERALRESGLDYAILRPTVLFGEGDVLINNIAWFARRFPLFLAPGDGLYRVQPMHVADFATLMASAAEARGPLVLDAVGPEIHAFDDLVRLIARALGLRVAIVHAPQPVVRAATALLGTLLGDVLLTREEIAGLCDDLLVSAAAPTGAIALSAWLAEHADELGRHYASEVARHYR